MNILAIETASTVCGVALFIGNEIREKDEVNQSRIHGKKLPIIVDSILKNHLINANELDGVAISAGPGSYTGLRIGMNFTRGLVASSKIPIIPVPTLSSINFTIQHNGEYSVMLHSHKNYVFAQCFNSGQHISEITFEKCKPKKNEIIYGFNLEELGIDLI